MIDYEDSFWTERGISPKVAEARGYAFFEAGDVSPIIDKCNGYGKDARSIAVQARMFLETSGIIIPRVDGLTGEARMPEIRPDKAVNIGPPIVHYHGNVPEPAAGGLTEAMNALYGYDPPKKKVKKNMDFLLELVPVSASATYCKIKKFEGSKKLVFTHAHKDMSREEYEEHQDVFHTLTEGPMERVHTHSVMCYKPSNKAVQQHVNKGH